MHLPTISKIYLVAATVSFGASFAAADILDQDLFGSFKESDNDKLAPKKSPVDVEMFVMSKCPDARDAVAQLILPVMAKVYESGILNLRPTFIGTPDDSNAGMACKHGPDECLGDIIELCAYELYKPEPQRWLGFINCMGQDYQNIPEDGFVKGCAMEYGLDFDKLEDCASSEDKDKGIDLLRTSAKRAIELDIQTSCTITIEGKTVCVRDDGMWRGCSGKPEDLIAQIQKAYNGR
ncbi:hypothetical protein AA313_de0207720 [Arthrobotrys entomopaga]|nr:hypothetical protein AA313_de0207720 [Arthrobotrys entomopaga]